MNSFRVISNVKLIASNVHTKKPQAFLLMVFAYAHYTPKSHGTCPKIRFYKSFSKMSSSFLDIVLLPL